MYSCSISNPNEPNAPPKSFTFDGVYGPDSTTEAIYNDNGFSLVEVSKNKNDFRSKVRSFACIIYALWAVG